MTIGSHARLFGALVLLAATTQACTNATDEDVVEETAGTADALGGTTGGPTCSPSRADGVLAAAPQALMDTIAWSEGTAGRGSDGYNVIVGYKYTTDCTRHPNRTIRLSKTLRSTAAGRYQFLYTTWTSLGMPTFKPENQERAGLKLVERRGVNVPSGRAMTATEFSNAMSKLSYEWASLPPNRYGQGSHSASQVRTEYCHLAGCSR